MLKRQHGRVRYAIELHTSRKTNSPFARFLQMQQNLHGQPGHYESLKRIRIKRRTSREIHVQEYHEIKFNVPSLALQGFDA